MNCQGRAALFEDTRMVDGGVSVHTEGEHPLHIWVCRRRWRILTGVLLLGFFQTLGDSVLTGPTMTNVNDFRAVLITETR